MAMSFRDRVRQKAKEAEFTGGSSVLKLKSDVAFWKPHKGNNDIMIVPFKMAEGSTLEDVDKGDTWYRMQYLRHTNVGPEKKMIVCPRTIGKKCPICEHRSMLINEKHKSYDDEEVKELTPKKRELYNVVDVDKDEDKVCVFDISYHCFGKPLEEELRNVDDDSPGLSFADPEGGSVIHVRMAEETFGKNNYFEAKRFDFTKAGPWSDEVLDSAVDFSQHLIILDYDKINAMFYDLDETENEEDVDYETGEVKEAPRKRFAGRPNLDDEEEEAPRTERKRPAPREEEEEQPKPKAKEAEEERPARKPAKQAEATPSEDNKCKHGGRFGVDCDSEKMAVYCDECDLWMECKDAMDNMPF